MDQRTDTTAPAPAASHQRGPLDEAVIDAIDELGRARIETLITMSLLEHEIGPNPDDPGFSYGLSEDQQEMLGQIVLNTLKSIDQALRVLETAR